MHYELAPNFTAVKGMITASIEGSAGTKVQFVVTDGDEQVLQEEVVISHGMASLQFHVKEPKLWYPHGYGEQSLYKVTAVLMADELKLHEISRRTGFRKGELIQQPDEIGKTFFFRINGVDVFCGGSDWIPADSFTPRVTEEKYRRWLEMMVDGYQVMIRYVKART